MDLKTTKPCEAAASAVYISARRCNYLQHLHCGTYNPSKRKLTIGPWNDVNIEGVNGVTATFKAEPLELLHIDRRLRPLRQTIGENEVSSTLKAHKAQRLKTRLACQAISSHEEGIGHPSERRPQRAFACELGGEGGCSACRMQVDGASLG